MAAAGVVVIVRAAVSAAAVALVSQRVVMFELLMFEELASIGPPRPSGRLTMRTVSTAGTLEADCLGRLVTRRVGRPRAR